MSKTILHITDLHINNPEGENELTRIKYYQEYIKPLAASIKKEVAHPIDLIVATGDFVNKGISANFKHAKKILDFIAKELNVKSDHITVCCGNHDIIKDKEKKGDAKSARLAYKKFAAGYANGCSSVVWQSQRGTLCKIAPDLWCLSIDSTLGSLGEDHPGDLRQAEIDTIITKCTSYITDSDYLVIATHYPTPIFPEDISMHEEGADWYKKHIWGDGTPLRERIKRIRIKGRTLWVYGDIHKSDAINLAGNYHISTGRFGTEVKNEETNIDRQVKVITLHDTNDEDTEIATFQYKFPGHMRQAQYGDWTAVNGIIRSWTPPIKKKEHIIRVKEPQKKITGGSKGIERIKNIELLDVELQNIIIENIKGRKLYSLGRFKTSEALISLSWISIGPLMNTADILEHVVDKMQKWLHILLKHKKADAKEALILGVDCWGSVLASQISAIVGSSNFCIGGRAKGKYHTPHERINNEVVENILNSKYVIFVSDVLATGHSINYLYDEITKIMNVSFSGDKRVAYPRSWYSLSIVMDEFSEANVNNPFIKQFVTACRRIRMPVLRNESLPDEDILPPTISFS